MVGRHSRSRGGTFPCWRAAWLVVAVRAAAAAWPAWPYRCWLSLLLMVMVQDGVAVVLHAGLHVAGLQLVEEPAEVHDHARLMLMVWLGPLALAGGCWRMRQCKLLLGLAGLAGLGRLGLVPAQVVGQGCLQLDAEVQLVVPLDHEHLQLLLGV